jgi:TonB family protein
MIEEKPQPALRGGVSEDTDYEVRQRSRMLVALALLLVALGMVVIKDWDFWFTPEQATDVDDVTDTTASVETSQTPVEFKPAPPTMRTGKHAAPKPVPAQGQTMPVITNRAALPPLQVEVVVGDEHRTLRPGSNSVKVDLRPRSPAVAENEATTTAANSEVAANSSATDASERVRLSADTSQVLTRPVNPDYPLLARQMKVQGSVMLQALIGRDGVIQDLRTLSGPAILAAAAQEAVKQWRFKPFLQAGEPVETQAHITVNFTISTN